MLLCSGGEGHWGTLMYELPLPSTASGDISEMMVNQGPRNRKQDDNTGSMNMRGST